MDIVIATRNLHKVREYRFILKDVTSIELFSLRDYPDYQPPEETGLTFEENAYIKASHAHNALKCNVLADDSGLVIPALNNEPGIYSARYAGENALDRENRVKLLKEMERLSEEDRVGYFACALAFIAKSGEEKCVTAYCEGTILTAEKGSNGFGYDPLFVKHDYSRSFAQLDEELKNKISHRRKAIDKLLPFLEALDTVSS